MVAVAGLAVLVLSGWRASGWRADYARVADRVAAAEPTERTAHGNVMCLDVCRQLTSTYGTALPAQATVGDAVERMRRHGFTDVGMDCEKNPWCSAWGSHDDVGVTVSQYKPDSWAAEQGVVDEFTVVVSMPE